MFSIIDRYVAKEFLKYFFSSLIIFVVLSTAVDMLTQIWHLNAESSTLWTYYLYGVPALTYQMIPVSCLMATIFTISVLSKNNELVALFASGLSLARITMPLLVLAALISISTFFISDKILPPFTKKRNYVLYVEIKKQPGQYYTVKTNKIWYRSHDLIYNIKSFNAEKGSMQGLTVYYFNPDWKLIQQTTAQEAIYETPHWHLKNGTVTIFDSTSSFPLTQNFKDKIITLDEKPTDLQSLENNSDVMTVSELRRYIKKNKEAALDTNRYEVAYHRKFGFAFVSFVMSFLGIPFSVTRNRSGGFAMNIGICFGLVFTYWLLVSIFNSFGTRGTLSGPLAAWTPNAIMLSVAVYFLLKLKK